MELYLLIFFSLRELKASQHYSNPRFVDRSKYVWTANKQPSQPTQRIPPKPIQSAPLIRPKRSSNPHELTVLTVTALDSPVAVAEDIALNLREEKVYLIRKYEYVLGQYLSQKFDQNKFIPCQNTRSILPT